MTLSVIFMESFAGFHTGATFTPTAQELAGKWNALPTACGTNYGRNGGYGTRLATSALLKTFATPLTIIGVGMAVRVTTGAGSGTDFQLACDKSPGPQILKISRSGVNGSLTAVASGGGTLGTTAAGVLPVDGLWHHLEMQAKASQTAGTLDIWIDGVSVLSLTGLNLGGVP
ncbi:MAG TPA: hypothetical protein VGT98_10985, partial [Candidatus Elarobacter sp.]|nr:hypothetical protein [Candidatus Elarobacter sp.]